MSVETNDKYYFTGSQLTSLGNAIRAKAGTSDLMTLSDAIDIIAELSNPSGKLTITDTVEKDVTNYATAQVVDANLVAGNIKDGVSILGVTGSFSGSGGGGSMPSWLYTGVITPVSDTTGLSVTLNADTIPAFAAIYQVDIDDLGNYNHFVGVAAQGDSNSMKTLSAYTGYNGTIAAANNYPTVTNFDATSVTFVTRGDNYVFKAGKAYRYIICLKEVIA